MIKKNQSGAIQRWHGSHRHQWHVVINKFNEGKYGNERASFMYAAKETADEVPRLAKLFEMEREGKLRQTHRQCSHAATVPVPNNHLTCCLGKKCAECPMLMALNNAKLRPEQIDLAKAWTCAAHILSEGGDAAGEGFVLTVDDRMYWDHVYENLTADHGRGQ